MPKEHRYQGSLTYKIFSAFCISGERSRMQLFLSHELCMYTLRGFPFLIWSASDKQLKISISNFCVFAIPFVTLINLEEQYHNSTEAALKQLTNCYTLPILLPGKRLVQKKKTKNKDGHNRFLNRSFPSDCCDSNEAGDEIQWSSMHVLDVQAGKLQFKMEEQVLNCIALLRSFFDC